jgi:serine/threonine-protein kinase
MLAASSEVLPLDWSGREVSGRYRVLDRIGEGGMGVVYAAEHLQLKKKVAFKVIHPELAANEELLIRFKREALATGQLDHPHIASAIDLDQLEDGSAFIVMPFVRGHSLQAELDSAGKMDLRRACKLGSQVADALSATHAVGIVHRDLKPDNVLIEQRLDGSESAKVLDFGVASLTGRSEKLSVDARPLTQAGTILGTPGYMSPEQATAGEIDHRTDLYALGVILWELCRGERLFAGDDVTQIFAKQFKQLPAALDLGTSQNAHELSALVQKLLAWDKAERPNSATEVRDTLRRLAEASDSPVPLTKQESARKVSLPYAVAAIALLVAALAWFDRAPAEEAPAAAESIVADEPVKAKAARKNTEKPSAAVAETKAKPAAAATSSKAMHSAVDDVIHARGRDTRYDAARLIHQHPAGAPKYAALAAELELATRCKDKQKVIEDIAELGDPRVLPALDRLASSPRRGCGMLRLNDCNACLRRELEQTIGALSAARK